MPNFLKLDKKNKIFLALFLTNLVYANNFNKIDIVGNHPAREKLLNISSKYLNKEMNSVSVSELYSELSNKLKDYGYITSNVNIVKGNINEGNILFEIVGGKVGKIYFSDNKISSRKIKTAFDLKEGDEFNIKDLDQGIDNLNIGGKDYKLEIVDSEKNNYSDVIVRDGGLEYQKFVNVSLDNSPSELFKVNLDASTEKYDLLNLNDTLKVSANTKLGLNILSDFDGKINVGYSIPKGYSTYRYNLGLSGIYKKEKSNTNKIYRTVFNINQKIDYSKILYKDKNQKRVFNASISANKANTWISGTKIDVTSQWDIYSTQSLSSNKKIDDAVLGVKATQEFGINSYYLKYLLDVNYDKDFNLNNNTLSYSMKSSAGVVMPKGVLDKKKIIIGDESTVRGFKNESSSGEFGAYINNTLTYKMKNTYFSPLIGLDFGVVKDSKLQEIDKLIGLSFGFNHSINRYNISAIISKGIRFPLDRGSEKYTVYLSVSKRF